MPKARYQGVEGRVNPLSSCAGRLQNALCAHDGGDSIGISALQPITIPSPAVCDGKGTARRKAELGACDRPHTHTHRGTSQRITTASTAKILDAFFGSGAMKNEARLPTLS